MFRNITTILESISKNNKYAQIFDTMEYKYFAPEFNHKIDVLLSNHSTQDLVKYYMGYKEMLDEFLFIVLRGASDYIKGESYNIELTDEENKVISLLIYKEIDFFVLKIETILNIDDCPMEIISGDDVIFVKCYNEEVVSITKEELAILKEMGMRYYTSFNKINSLINFIKSSNVDLINKKQ